MEQDEDPTVVSAGPYSGKGHHHVLLPTTTTALSQSFTSPATSRLTTQHRELTISRGKHPVSVLYRDEHAHHWHVPKRLSHIGGQEQPNIADVGFTSPFALMGSANTDATYTHI